MKKLLFLLLFPAFAKAQIITTIAGTGTVGFGGDAGPATNAQVNSVEGIAVDNSGNVYFSDYLNARIRKIEAVSGIITTVAGNGSHGFSGDGGQATNAQMDHAVGLCLNHAGNILYIADDFNHVVRKVDLTSGIISTIAGVPTVSGDSGDGGPATAAKFHFLVGIWKDGAGNLYVCGAQNYFVRKIDLAAGMAYRFAGNGVMGCTTGDGGPATSAGIITPMGGSMDAHGNTYIVSNYSSVTTNVRKVDTAGIMHAFAGTCIGGFSGDGGPATAAQVIASSIVSDPWGNVYLGEEDNHRLRLVDTNGIIHTISADPALGSLAEGIPLSSAKVNPTSVAFDNSGNLYIGEYNRLRKVAHVFTPPEPGTLGAHIVTAKADALIVPNPSNGLFTVKHSATGAYEIRVYNIVGEKVYEGIGAVSTHIIDLSGKAPGVYLISVKDDQATVIQKILLN